MLVIIISMRDKAQPRSKPIEVVEKYVKIQSLIDSKLIYRGQISGQLYEWQRAGGAVFRQHGSY